MLFLFAIRSLPCPFKPMGLSITIMLTRPVSMLLKVHHRRILWLRVEKDRGEDLNHIHGKQTISQASVSAPLGWRLDHGGGPFEDAVSRALDSASLLRFGGPVHPFLLLS